MATPVVAETISAFDVRALTYGGAATARQGLQSGRRIRISGMAGLDGSGWRSPVGVNP
jgi:hypothetical protein